MVKNLKVLYMYALCVPFNPFDLRPCTDGEGGGAEGVHILIWCRYL